MKQIIIEIRGGVANVTKKSAGVELIIKDFDVSDENDVERNEDGDPYIEETYDFYSIFV